MLERSLYVMSAVKTAYSYSPLYHYRQSSLAFERNWKTKLRFLKTLLGVCITNSFLMHDLEYMKSQSTGFSHNSNSSNENDQEEKLNFTNFFNKLAS